jgi:hypothetical protein
MKSSLKSASDAFLYFHAPCFDGIASAVVASDFLENSQRWTIKRFCAVDYGARAAWLSSQLHEPCAVVDFIYHPQALFWADHHSTTFLTQQARLDFANRADFKSVIYDGAFGSCARLLSQAVKERFAYCNPRFAELVDWAEKIDAARYTTVTEAVLGDAPALRIRASLGFRREPEYFEQLVRALKRQTLADVARLPDVEESAKQVQSRVRAGLKRFEKGAWLADDGIVLFDVNGQDAVVSRYAPYYFYPNARYSAGIVRSELGAKITAMRNPWREFPSVALGAIFEQFGGGGHERVGSLLLPPRQMSEARLVLDRIVEAVRSQDAMPEPAGKIA